MKILEKFIIKVVRIYKYIFSPLIGFNCRYLPTCSEYFIDCIKLNGAFKGSILGIKRILKCHPIKFLGGGSGYDPAPELKRKK
tara:strand:+ start:950 stop:1198 length:249 start_codon:yes stop_codon:yes gene_type:complete